MLFKISLHDTGLVDKKTTSQKRRGNAIPTVPKSHKGLAP